MYNFIYKLARFIYIKGNFLLILINFDEAHTKARKDFESFELLVKNVEHVLADPSFETCDEIDGIKN